ncbi:FAD binding domain [Rhizoctonia solani]|uniref:FAD binding domain n=3 Tax=Rhizoctonia solani TaxID=456999 RepID=A0A8H7HG76_9AGAM|nr:FAD binding domain [Rhizoctonia solani]
MRSAGHHENADQRTESKGDVGQVIDTEWPADGLISHVKPWTAPPTCVNDQLACRKKTCTFMRKSDGSYERPKNCALPMDRALDWDVRTFDYKSMGVSKNFEVSIIGGGIGGLSAAIGLIRAGIPVQVFEAACQFSEIGAGVSFGTNARNALAKLGLQRDFEEQLTTIPSGIWFEWRNGQGQEQELIATTYSNPLGNSSVHRADFLDVMVKHVPKSISHFGKRLVSIEKLSHGSGKNVRLHFQDGSSHDTDLVIGYDGIHSKVREYLQSAKRIANTGSGKAELQWSGSWAWRGMIPTEKFLKGVPTKMGEHYSKIPQMFLGKDRHILIFPINKFSTINVVAFATDRSQWPDRPKLKEGEAWTQKSTQEEMVAQFPGWADDIINILKCIEEPNKWALHELNPTLDTYVDGTVCVAGDAAHAGTPHQGALAGQAIEDALFLTWLLSQPSINRANLADALQVYDSVRRPRANKVSETSFEAGEIYEFALDRTGSDFSKLREELESRYEWIWGHDHEEDFIKARQEMEIRGLL